MFKKDAKKNEKKDRKLKLSRETLRNLSASELTQVNGGKRPSGSCISIIETENGSHEEC